MTLAQVGDISDDGRSDFLAVWSTPPTVVILSGYDGVVLRQLHTGLEGQRIRHAGTVGDVDGDGIRETYLSKRDVSSGRQSIVLVGSASGKVSELVAATVESPRFGATLLVLGWEGGAPVFAYIDGPCDDAAQTHCHRVSIVKYNPANGKPERQSTEVQTSSSLVALRMHSGVTERKVVVSEFVRKGNVLTTAVCLQDLTTGSLLWRQERRGDSLFGSQVLALDDLNSDGWGEVGVVSTPSLPQVEILSGINGQVLTLVRPARGEWLSAFGECVANAGDWSGDGHDDMLVTDPAFTDGAGQVLGVVYAMDAATGTLSEIARGQGTMGDFGRHATDLPGLAGNAVAVSSDDDVDIISVE